MPHSHCSHHYLLLCPSDVTSRWGTETQLEGAAKGSRQQGWLSAPRCSSLFFLPLLPLSSSCWCCSFLPHSRSKRLEETVRNTGSSYKLTDATAWFLSRASSSFDLHCLLRLLRAVLAEVAELHMDEVGTEKCGCLGAKAGY